MLISNGKITRNISADRLPEYVAKGYREAVKKTAPATPKAPKKGKE